MFCAMSDGYKPPRRGNLARGGFCVCAWGGTEGGLGRKGVRQHACNMRTCAVAGHPRGHAHGPHPILHPQRSCGGAGGEAQGE